MDYTVIAIQFLQCFVHQLFAFAGVKASGDGWVKGGHELFLFANYNKIVFL